MEKERLVIRNFGPIKSVNIDLGKMTILIGEQATGKSTIAKVLAMCRYFSYIVNFSLNKEDHSKLSKNDQFYEGLRDWDLDFYLSKTSYIKYENSVYKFEFQNKYVVEYENIGDGTDLKKEFYDSYTKISPKVPEFKKLLFELDNLRSEEANVTKTSMDLLRFFGWMPNENFFRLNVKKVMDNPLYIPTERNIHNATSIRTKALQDEVIKINNIVSRYNSETHIAPLSITYKNQNGNGYVKKGRGSFHPLFNGASGYQSTIPLVLAIKYYNEIEKRQRTFIVEEPELNLFPSAQKKLVEFLVESLNRFKNNRFLIPTHSPYIVSSLNNLMVAYRIGQKKKEKVTEIVDEKFWINPVDVKAYRLVVNEKGKGVISEDIILQDLQEISVDYLDSISKEINSVWDKLIEIEDEN